MLDRIRNRIPEVTLRTTLIVGFPGETKKDFEELKKFVEQAKFDKLGAFMYSKEEGTPAAKLTNQVHGNTKKARYHQIMKLQQEISKQNLEKKLNQECEVLIEDISFDGKYYIGRTKQDVPEIDGLVYIKTENLQEQSMIGQFKMCKVVGISNYDVMAEFLRKESKEKCKF